MLTVRFGQLTVEGLSPSKIHSLAGCSQDLTPSFASFARFPTNRSVVAMSVPETLRRGEYPVALLVHTFGVVNGGQKGLPTLLGLTTRRTQTHPLTDSMFDHERPTSCRR